MAQDYTENVLVQGAACKQLATQGWRIVDGREASAMEALGRVDECEVLLKNVLREQLMRINDEWFTEREFEQVYQQLSARRGMLHPVEENKQMYDLLRDGIMVSWMNSVGVQEQRRVRIFDFTTPEKNSFIAVKEFWIKSRHLVGYRRRADIVGFVNGIPLLFVELKGIGVDLQDAYNGNYRDYCTTVPQLFVHNAAVIFSNGRQTKMGAFGSAYSFFHEWKRLDEGDAKGSTELIRLLQGLWTPTALMDLFENFILFEKGTKRYIKIVARNHQMMGVNKAVDAYYRREALQGKLGVFWHTQGSGKSYSMVFLTQKLYRQAGNAPCFLFVLDRDDLQDQLSATFESCGVMGSLKQADVIAHSEEDLYAKLERGQQFIFTLIQKFRSEHAPIPENAHILMLSDEAHRSQYGTYAENLQATLPAAARIGFTGTPLLKDDLTARTFGGYLSIYDFQRAVEDGATVPLYYEAHGKALQIERDPALNQEIAELIDEAETDPLKREMLEQYFAQRGVLLEAEKRMRVIAEDLVVHSSNRWQAGKAMMVCLNKVSCVRMYNYVQEAWARAIQNEVDAEKRAWMASTEMAVVVSQEQNEIEVFRNWGCDITPHREKMATRHLDKEFKDRENPLRLVFVCAMWLTGFDVKSLSCLYLDKPMKAHTLMQTITRVNRVDEGKPGGVIVDYAGVIEALREALADYTTDTAHGASVDPCHDLSEVIATFRDTLTKTAQYLWERDCDIQAVLKATDEREKLEALAGIAECLLKDLVTKNGYLALVGKLKRLMKLFETRHLTSFEVNQRNALFAIAEMVNVQRKRTDISELSAMISERVNERLRISSLAESEGIDISGINFAVLQNVRASKHKKLEMGVLLEQIRKRIDYLLNHNPTRINFLETYRELIERYNAVQDPEAVEKLFIELIQLTQRLTQEEQRYVTLGFDNEEQLAIYDLLLKEKITKKDITTIKRVAKELLIIVKQLLADAPATWTTEQGQAQFKVTLRNQLFAFFPGFTRQDYEACKLHNLGE